MPQKQNAGANDRLSDNIDSEKDKQNMQAETVEVLIPDINEIPGQENVVPAPLGEMADTTISSADEEGGGLFNEDAGSGVIDDEDSNVSAGEKEDLRRSANDMPGDDENLRRAALDNTDNDGAPLNEDGFKRDLSGSDLDVPGAALDDANEQIGEEDEENNQYSVAGTEEPPQDDF